MGFFKNPFKKPFMALEHKVEKGGKAVIKVIKHHPVESIILGTTIVLGGAVILATGGLAAPFVGEAAAAEAAALTAAAATEAAAIGTVEAAAIGTAEAAAIGTAEVAATGTAEAATIAEAIAASEEATAVGSAATGTAELSVPLLEGEAVAEQTALQSIKATVERVSATAVRNFNTVEGYLERLTDIITNNSFVRGLQAVKASRIIKLFTQAVLAFEAVKDAIEMFKKKNNNNQDRDTVVQPEDPEEPEDDKIQQILDQMNNLKDILSDEKSQTDKLKIHMAKEELENQERLLEQEKKFQGKLTIEEEKINKTLQNMEQLKNQLSENKGEMTELKKHMIQEELRTHQKILDQAKDFKSQIDAEKLKDVILSGKNERLEGEIGELEGELEGEKADISNIRNEVDHMKNLVAESFLRDLDFDEFMLLLKTLEAGEIVQFLARNRGDFEKLTKNNKKLVIDFAKIKMNL
jgi:hypothetical protein